MMRNVAFLGNKLIREIFDLLAEQLPPGWKTTSRAVSAKGGWEPDALIEVAGPDGKKCILVVKAKMQLQPKDVDRVADQLRRYVEVLGKPAVPIFVSPFITESTREKLQTAQVGYADKTGNIRVVSSRPALFIQAQGAESDPNRENRPARSLKGSKAGRIVRALCDLVPPLGIRELAEKTDINPGYVSRVVSFLEAEALLEREPRGPITLVKWRNLIQRWAKDYDFQRSNRVLTFLDPRDVLNVPQKLSASNLAYAITGSAAAATAAPVAPTRFIMAYVEDPEATAKAIGLRPADSGANVLLAEPYDRVVFTRTRKSDGIQFAALSQVAVDLLTAPGRSPAEAESLLDWMENNEKSWRP